MIGGWAKLIRDTWIWMRYEWIWMRDKDESFIMKCNEMYKWWMGNFIRENIWLEYDLSHNNIN